MNSPPIRNINIHPPDVDTSERRRTERMPVVLGMSERKMYMLLMADLSQVCDGRSADALRRDSDTSNNSNSNSNSNNSKGGIIDTSEHVKRRDVVKVKRSNNSNSSSSNDGKLTGGDDDDKNKKKNSHRLSWHGISASKKADVVDTWMNSSWHSQSSYTKKIIPQNSLWNSYLPVSTRGKREKDAIVNNNQDQDQHSHDVHAHSSDHRNDNDSHRPSASEGSLGGEVGPVDQSSALFIDIIDSDTSDAGSAKEDLNQDDDDKSTDTFDTVEMSPSTTEKKVGTNATPTKKDQKKKKAEKKKQAVVVLPRRSSDPTSSSTTGDRSINNLSRAASSASTSKTNSSKVTLRKKFQPRHRCQSINDSVTGIVKPSRYSPTMSSSSQATTASTIATSTHSSSSSTIDNNDTNHSSSPPRPNNGPRLGRRKSLPHSFSLLPKQLSGSLTQLKPDEIKKIRDTLIDPTSASTSASSTSDESHDDDDDDDDEHISCMSADNEKGGGFSYFRRSNTAPASTTSSNGSGNGTTVGVEYVDISTHSNSSWIPTGVDFSANMEVYVFQKIEDA